MAAAGWSNYPDCLHWSKSYTDLSAMEGLDGKLTADGGFFVRLSGIKLGKAQGQRGRLPTKIFPY